MIHDGKVLGYPLVQFPGTQAQIEALAMTPADAGALAWASDKKLLGRWDGTEWLWGLEEAAPYTAEPTGFVDPAGIQITYNIGSVTLVHASGYVQYLWRGVLHVLESPWTSPEHPAWEPTFTAYLYSTDGTTFAWSKTIWQWSDIQVAWLHCGEVAPELWMCLRECHGLMPWQTHEALHRQIGTYRLSGGALTAATYAIQPASPTDNDNRPGIDAAIIVDEDLESSIAAVAESAERMLLWFAGAGTPQAASDEIDSYSPLRVGSVYPLINAYSGSSFSDAETVTGRYVNVYTVMFPVTLDSGSQLFRVLWLQPQFAYTSLAAAEAEDFRNLYLGGLSQIAPEFVAYARITYRTSASYTTFGKVRIEAVSYLSGPRASQAVSAPIALAAHSALLDRDLPDQHPASAITNTPAGNVAATNIQAAINELDGDKEVAGAAAAAVAAHTALPSAHHSRYTDTEAKVVADTQIADHTATPSAHHSRYTDAEALAAIPQAATTVQGKIELATTAEAQAGTDTVRAVTPAGLRADVPTTPAVSRGVRLDASGHLVLPSGGSMYGYDAFVDGDAGGLRNRVTGCGYQDVINEHFDGAIGSGWAWAADAAGDYTYGAPTSGPATTVSELRFGGANRNHFYYRAVVASYASTSFIARILGRAAVGNYVGIRLDDSTDPANRYIELYEYYVTGEGIKIEARYNNGAGETIVDVERYQPVGLWKILRIYASGSVGSWAGHIHTSVDVTTEYLVGTGAVRSWTPDRVGICQRVTSTSTRYLLCDFVYGNICSW